MTSAKLRGEDCRIKIKYPDNVHIRDTYDHFVSCKVFYIGLLFFSLTLNRTITTKVYLVIKIHVIVN